MGRSSIPDIQFKRDDREEIRLEKLRRLSEAVQSIARAIDALTPTPAPGSTGITMTGPGVLGRLAGTGLQQTLTGTQVNSLLPVFTAATKGVVPASGDATGLRFLRDDGSFTEIEIPPGALEHSDLAGLDQNDHPQYVLRSILTDVGDLFTYDGDVVIRLGRGAEGQLLRSTTAALTWQTFSPTIALTGSVSGSATMTNLGSVTIDTQAASPEYLAQTTAIRAWLVSEFVRGLNIIGVRYPGPAIVYIPHTLPAEYVVTVKAEHADTKLTVRIY